MNNWIWKIFVTPCIKLLWGVSLIRGSWHCGQKIVPVATIADYSCYSDYTDYCGKLQAGGTIAYHIISNLDTPYQSTFSRHWITLTNSYYLVSYSYQYLASNGNEMQCNKIFFTCVSKLILATVSLGAAVCYFLLCHLIQLLTNC